MFDIIGMAMTIGLTARSAKDVKLRSKSNSSNKKSAIRRFKMITTIVRFESSNAINITETVYQTARRNKGAFHIENIAFDLEVQDIMIVEKASTKDTFEAIGKNQIRHRLNEIVKYDGRLKSLSDGWYTWV
jgi:hypothetical protein